MKGKSKSKKLLDVSKPKVSIENLYKKYKSQESYNDFKILTRNFNTKITLQKPNIGGISPTNNNNNNLTNNSLSNILNNNSNSNSNSNNNSKKPSLQLKNFFETVNSTNYNYSKMISPNSLRSNLYSNAMKNTNEKNTKMFNLNLAVKNTCERNKIIINTEKIDKNKLPDNSFEIDEVNSEKRFNFNNDLMFNNLDATLNSNSNEKEKSLFSSRGRVNVKISKNDSNSKINEIKGKDDSANKLNFEAFKNTNNFYTSSICEAPDSFIEKGDKNLINNVPGTFVRQTENRLLENTSSKKLIHITNYHTNREPISNNFLNKNVLKKKDLGNRIISEENLIDSDSYVTKIKEENVLRNENDSNNLAKKLNNRENTPKREYEKIKFSTESFDKKLNFNLDLNKNLIKNDSTYRQGTRGVNLLSQLDLNKNFSNEIMDLSNLKTYSKRESQKEFFEQLTPSDKCYKNLLNYSKKGDKESFLEALSELYAIEGQNLDIHIANESGKNCLHLACEEGNLKIVEILLKLNFNFELKVNDKHSKKTALHVSSEKGYFDITKMLIEKGAQIDSFDADLNTPLHLCALNNHIELFQYLLEKYRNTDASKNSNGQTAFDLALDENKNNDVREKFNKIINENYPKLSDTNKILSNNNKNIYEPSPRKMHIKPTTNFSNSNNSNSKSSHYSSNIYNSGSKKNEKINLDLKSNNREKSKITNSKKNSSKQLSYNSKIFNNFNTVNTSNMISDLSTNLINFSKKDSSDISNSQYSNYKSNFNYYRNNNQRLSSNKNKNLSSSNNNLSNKNILNSNSKHLDDSSNYKAQTNLEKTNKIKTINFNIGDLSNSSNSNSKITKKTNSVSSNNMNSNSISSKFKKIESGENISSEINNFSNTNSNNDLDSSYNTNNENIDCLRYLNENKKVNVSDFTCHLILGKGSFGEVYLVEEKSSKKFYAMKVLKKEKIIGLNLIRYALTERNILAITDHPFIVKLHYSFQTKDKLFLILDFCPGGDLSEHLTNQRRFSEEIAKIYLCEIILAIEDLHKKDIIFRDLKPDNIVLDEDGHALLTDFGLSKEGVYDNIGAKSFCGSIAYLAPEMLSRSGHGKSVDWYLLGVVFYEMLVGLPPYFNLNKEELFKNIEHGKITYPDYLSPKATDLLRKLLIKNPYTRLGSGKKGADEIKSHPYFDGINWDDVFKRKLNPPKPRIKSQIRAIIYNENRVLKDNLIKNFSLMDDEIENSERINYIDNWSFVNNNIQK